MENFFEMKMTKAEIDSISNLGLAHMGDCVFEILVRAYLCASGEKTVDKLHRDTIRMVKATSQAEFAEKINSNQRTVSNWEVARCAPPLELFPVIASALKTSIRNLMPKE
jgi:23S rRNA maturation mini-RNase III